jgi:hypothetical protein
MTFLSRRRCVLPQPAQATAISGSPFLFLLTIGSQKYPFPSQSFPMPLFGFEDRCSFVSPFVQNAPVPEAALFLTV